MAASGGPLGEEAREAVGEEPRERSSGPSPGLLVLPILPLYTRLKSSRITRHPLRSRILDLLEEKPGLNAYQLGKATARSLSGVQYQLDVLLRAGLVAQREQRGIKRFFRVGDPRIPETLETLDREAPRARLLRAIRESPGVPIREAAAAARLAYNNARYHLQELEKEGVIRRERDGSFVKLTALQEKPAWENPPTPSCTPTPGSA